MGCLWRLILLWGLLSHTFGASADRELLQALEPNSATQCLVSRLCPRVISNDGNATILVELRGSGCPAASARLSLVVAGASPKGGDLSLSSVLSSDGVTVTFRTSTVSAFRGAPPGSYAVRVLGPSQRPLRFSSAVTAGDGGGAATSSSSSSSNTTNSETATLTIVQAPVPYFTGQSAFASSTVATVTVSAALDRPSTLPTTLGLRLSDPTAATILPPVLTWRPGEADSKNFTLQLLHPGGVPVWNQGGPGLSGGAIYLPLAGGAAASLLFAEAVAVSNVMLNASGGLLRVIVEEPMPLFQVLANQAVYRPGSLGWPAGGGGVYDLSGGGGEQGTEDEGSGGDSDDSPGDGEDGIGGGGGDSSGGADGGGGGVRVYASGTLANASAGSATSGTFPVVIRRLSDSPFPSTFEYAARVLELTGCGVAADICEAAVSAGGRLTIPVGADTATVDLGVNWTALPEQAVLRVGLDLTPVDNARVLALPDNWTAIYVYGTAYGTCPAGTAGPWQVPQASAQAAGPAAAAAAATASGGLGIAAPPAGPAGSAGGRADNATNVDARLQTGLTTQATTDVVAECSEAALLLALRDYSPSPERLPLLAACSNGSSTVHVTSLTAAAVPAAGPPAPPVVTGDSGANGTRGNSTAPPPTSPQSQPPFASPGSQQQRQPPAPDQPPQPFPSAAGQPPAAPAGSTSAGSLAVLNVPFGYDLAAVFVPLTSLGETVVVLNSSCKPLAPTWQTLVAPARTGNGAGKATGGNTTSPSPPAGPTASPPQGAAVTAWARWLLPPQAKACSIVLGVFATVAMESGPGQQVTPLPNAGAGGGALATAPPPAPPAAPGASPGAGSVRAGPSPKPSPAQPASASPARRVMQASPAVSVSGPPPGGGSTGPSPSPAVSPGKSSPARAPANITGTPDGVTSNSTADPGRNTTSAGGSGNSTAGTKGNNSGGNSSSNSGNKSSSGSATGGVRAVIYTLEQVRAYNITLRPLSDPRVFSGDVLTLALRHGPSGLVLPLCGVPQPLLLAAARAKFGGSFRESNATQLALAAGTLAQAIRGSPGAAQELGRIAPVDSGAGTGRRLLLRALSRLGQWLASHGSQASDGSVGPGVRSHELSAEPRESSADLRLRGRGLMQAKDAGTDPAGTAEPPGEGGPVSQAPQPAPGASAPPPRSSSSAPGPRYPSPIPGPQTSPSPHPVPTNSSAPPALRPPAPSPTPSNSSNSTGPSASPAFAPPTPSNASASCSTRTPAGQGLPGRASGPEAFLDLDLRLDVPNGTTTARLLLNPQYVEWCSLAEAQVVDLALLPDGYDLVLEASSSSGGGVVLGLVGEGAGEDSGSGDGDVVLSAATRAALAAQRACSGKSNAAAAAGGPVSPPPPTATPPVAQDSVLTPLGRDGVTGGGAKSIVAVPRTSAAAGAAAGPGSSQIKAAQSPTSSSDRTSLMGSGANTPPPPSNGSPRPAPPLPGSGRPPAPGDNSTRPAGQQPASPRPAAIPGPSPTPGPSSSPSRGPSPATPPPTLQPQPQRPVPAGCPASSTSLLTPDQRLRLTLVAPDGVSTASLTLHLYVDYAAAAAAAVAAAAQCAAALSAAATAAGGASGNATNAQQQQQQQQQQQPPAGPRSGSGGGTLPPTASPPPVPAAQALPPAGLLVASLALPPPQSPLDACRLCGAGSYSSAANASVCLGCRPGYYSSGPFNEGCSPCPAGMFASQANSSSCKPCIAGSYATSPGSAACLLCPPGRTSLADGARDCVAPPPPPSSSDAGGKFALVVSFQVVLNVPQPGGAAAALTPGQTGIDAPPDSIMKALVAADTATALRIPLSQVRVSLMEVSPSSFLVNVSATMPMGQLSGTGADGTSGGASGGSGASVSSPDGDVDADTLINRLVDNPDGSFPRTKKATQGSVQVQYVQREVVPLTHGRRGVGLHVVLWPTLAGTLVLALAVGFACSRYCRRRRGRSVGVGAGGGLPPLTDGLGLGRLYSWKTPGSPPPAYLVYGHIGTLELQDLPPTSSSAARHRPRAGSKASQQGPGGAAAGSGSGTGAGTGAGPSEGLARSASAAGVDMLSLMYTRDALAAPRI